MKALAAALAITLCGQMGVIAEQNKSFEAKPKATYMLDKNNIRYQLVNQNPQHTKTYNWLFVPGGPGLDSSSLFDLSQLVDLPGNTWLVDFPGNGDHTEGLSEDYDYGQWFELAVPMVKQFENPIYVGVSFGGILSLLTPELENNLSGLVLLSSTPKLWLEAAAQCAKKYNLPDFSPQMAEFIQNPTKESCQKALEACLPYYFYKEESLKICGPLVLSTPFAFQPAFWWMHKAVKDGYTASWIPQNIPTLIVGGDFDYMTPFDIFKDDLRFQRPNIKFSEIKEAGHLCWIDNPNAVKAAFQDYLEVIKLKE
jgi:pimeloyl-ACP methyl ester carboxylesterase